MTRSALPETDIGRLAAACSVQLDVQHALGEIRERLAPAPGDSLLLFAGTEHAARRIEKGLQTSFDDVAVYGCTTAGEIGELGYVRGGIAALLLPAAEFRVVPVPFDDLHSFRVDEAARRTDAALARLAAIGEDPVPENSFGLLLLDGLSRSEELVAFTVGDRLGELGSIGGSAADAMRFERSYVVHEGQLRTNAGCLLLVQTQRPFRLFQTQNFVPTEERVVVTAADPPARVLLELDGMPAAQRYAELTGVDVRELRTEVFAHYPLMLSVGGTWFVRSIQRVGPGGLLATHCAIEEGLVLRVGRRGPLVAPMRQLLARLDEELQGLRGALVFDCVERRVQLETAGALGEVSELAQRHGLVGFSTFGEQWRALHVNQTMTGVAFG